MSHSTTKANSKNNEGNGQLNVNRKNIANRFCERNGFIVINEEDTGIGDGYYMNDYVMEKNL